MTRNATPHTSPSRDQSRRRVRAGLITRHSGHGAVQRSELELHPGNPDPPSEPRAPAARSLFDVSRSALCRGLLRARVAHVLCVAVARSVESVSRRAEPAATAPRHSRQSPQRLTRTVLNPLATPPHRHHYRAAAPLLAARSVSRPAQMRVTTGRLRAACERLWTALGGSARAAAGGRWRRGRAGQGLALAPVADDAGARRGRGDGLPAR